jgi:hypothetical protein
MHYVYTYMVTFDHIRLHLCSHLPILIISFNLHLLSQHPCSSEEEGEQGKGGVGPLQFGTDHMFDSGRTVTSSCRGTARSPVTAEKQDEITPEECLPGRIFLRTAQTNGSMLEGDSLLISFVS